MRAAGTKYWIIRRVSEDTKPYIVVAITERGIEQHELVCKKLLTLFMEGELTEDLANKARDSSLL